MERDEENYLRLSFTASRLPAVENHSRDKAQMDFIMIEKKMNSPLCHLGAWIFIRPHWLDFPGKCPSEGHSLIKQRKNTRAAPAFIEVRTSWTLWGSADSPPGTNTSQFMTSFTHRSCHIWSLKLMCHSSWAAKGFVPTGKAVAEVLVVLQLFHALPPTVPCHGNPGEKLESSPNISHIFSLSFHKFIHAKRSIIKEREKKD